MAGTTRRIRWYTASFRSAILLQRASFDRMNAQLELKSVSVRLQQTDIIHDFSLSMAKGQIGCLLGPSGCGKTTLLRAIAGFETPTSGTVVLGDQTIADSHHSTPPETRNIGMVFQDLALFPHLNVFRNVAFGLQGLSQRMSRRAIHERVNQLLDLVGMLDYATSYPHQLSGGQQQRVALIRAMAPKPDLLLMDEPFSAQDTELRVQLAHEVRDIIKADNMTAVLVTHDQYEAFAIADRIGVIRSGRLLQWDSAYDLYHQPVDKFVADFIGEGVFICGSAMSDNWIQTELGMINGEFDPPFEPGALVDLLVRPDDVIHDDRSANRGTVIKRDFRGADHLYTLVMPGSTRLLCLAPSHHNHQPGEKIGVRLALDHVVAFGR